MSRVYVDTSAFLALLIDSDEAHENAKAVFLKLKQQDSKLVTCSYVLVECYALLGRRVGTDAVKGFRQKMEPLLEIVWVDEELHGMGLNLLETRRTKKLSLVDAVSFVTMGRLAIHSAFAFDKHFAREGFEVL